MPLIRIDLIEGRSDAALRALLDAAHEAVLEAFGVPSRDRYQIITEHKPGRMVLLDTGLGFERDDKAVVVQVFSSPRTTKMKQDFYRLLTEKLEKQCGIPPNDVLISIMTNSKEDWSFGFGRAQFLTGEL
jgi:phenylpyruvate tautomerase PptA (4-oxalocrotonate tautomerase family)